MGIVGLSALFLFLIIAIIIFIYCGFKNDPYIFLEKDVPFELEYGLRGLVIERKNKFNSTYIISNIIATCLCLISPLPLIISGFFDNDMLSIMMMVLMMIIAGIGAFIFIVVGIQNASMQKLLQEGEFTRKEKRRSTIKEIVGSLYWSVVVIVYFYWSFQYNAWHYSWLVFVISGILFPIVINICNYIADKNSID
jgi:hypothetical protein